MRLLPHTKLRSCFVCVLLSSIFLCALPPPSSTSSIASSNNNAMKLPWTQCLLLLASSTAASSNERLNFHHLRWGHATSSSSSSSSPNDGRGNAAAAASAVAAVVAVAPSADSSTAPTGLGNETTVSLAPTVSPAPTVTPSPTTGNETASPAPSLAPTHRNETLSPVPSVAPTTSNETDRPTEAPATAAPSEAPHDHRRRRRVHWWKVLGKTAAWMVLAGLSVLAFGSCMSNRYRIYYYLRGSWFSFLRLGCTRSILRTLRLDGFVFGGGRRGRDSSLNDVIFEGGNDLHEGLLMRETIG